MLLATLLASCGGGGSGDDTGPPAPAPAPSSGGSVPVATGPRIEPYESTRPLSSKSAPQPRPAVVTPAIVRLDALPPEAASRVRAQAQAAQAGSEGVPRQVGLARALAASADVAATGRLLRWQRTADGHWGAAASFRSEGASAIRLGMAVERLPADARVRVAAPDGRDAAEFSGEQILSLLARQAPGERRFWLPPVGGADAVLEILLAPGSEPRDVAVAVPQLSHLWVDLARGEDSFLKIGESASCNVDASCQVSYLDESRAVARMEFVSGGNTFLCTGTLLADTGATGTPWFLSARHCITDAGAAASLVTYWFYRSSSCNSASLGRQSTRLTGGAELLFASPSTDTALLRLLSAPPPGVLFAGSLLAAPPTGTQVVGLHHPLGDLLKFSQGNVGGYAGCTGDDVDRVACGQSGDSYATVRWTTGTTQRGSSGSALFTPLGANAYVTGHLYAGLASCLRPEEPDYYGRFDIPYRESLYRWLGEVAGSR